MIVIIDYGMGNVSSIKNMAKYLGYECTVSDAISDIETAEKLILPGVGNFGKAMQALTQRNLIPLLNRKAMEEKKPLLGICLGMQLLTNYSEEGNCKGLGWIDAEVKKFTFPSRTDLKIPHMGWDYIDVLQNSKIVENLIENSRFYFVHSYAVHCNRAEQAIASTEYGYSFHSIIQNENVVGTQFHPEKSHKYGMKILKNFLEGF